MEKELNFDDKYRILAKDEFLEFLKVCPQVAIPSIGLVAFEKELEEALLKFTNFRLKPIKAD